MTPLALRKKQLKTKLASSQKNLVKFTKQLRTHQPKIKKIKLTKSFFFLLASLLLGFFLLGFFIDQSIAQEENLTLLSFFIIHSVGYLFFILSFVEILFVHLLTLDYSPSLLVVLAVSGAMIAQTIDYFIGYFASQKVITQLIGEKKHARFMKKINMYGDGTLFLFNLFPLSSPILILVAGMLRYPWWRVLLYSFVGLLLKYSLLVVFLS